MLLSCVSIPAPRIIPLPALPRTVLDGYRSTQHLLQSPMLGLDAMLTPEAAAEMWIRLMHVCISVSFSRGQALLAGVLDQSWVSARPMVWRASTVNMLTTPLRTVPPFWVQLLEIRLASFCRTWRNGQTGRDYCIGRMCTRVDEWVRGSEYRCQ